MPSATYAQFIERESTHAVYRKHVQIRLRSATDTSRQARLIHLAIALADLARSFDPVFDSSVEAVGDDELLLEFELNFPNRFGSAVNDWIEEEAKIRPEILDLLVPTDS